MREKILSFIEKNELSWFEIIIGIIGSIVLRTIFENFSNPEPTGIISPVPVFLNYATFFIAGFIGIFILIKIFTHLSYKKIGSMVTFGSLIIVFPPIFDKITRTYACMAYLGDTGTAILKNYLLFFFQKPSYCGATLGMKIEIIIILLGIGFFIYYITQSKIKAIVGVLSSYTYLFILGSLPGIVGTFANSAPDILFNNLYESSLAGSIHFLHSHIGQQLIPFEISSMIITRIQWVIILLGILIMTAIERSALMVPWLVEVKRRFVQYFVYIGLFFFGTILSIIQNGTTLSFHVLDAFSLVLVFFGFFAGCLGILALNNYYDKKTDHINDTPNTNALLNISEESSKRGALVILGLGGISMLLVSYTIAVLYLGFIASYFFHSSKIQFKRHWVGSSIMIACASCMAMLIGYFFINPSQIFEQAPIFIIGGMSIFFGIIQNLKDISDAPGDRHAQIKTIPVIVGNQKTYFFIAVLLIFWKIIFPEIISWLLIILIVLLLIGLGLFKKYFSKKQLFLVIIVIGLLGVSEFIISLFFL